MKVNDSIFRSRDIRGIYPEELNDETAFLIGQAFVAKTGALKIVVGHDMRISSPSLFENLVKGIISQGADVFSIGQVPTECLYFATVNYGYDAGIMITASHNPKDYNGFKMFKAKENGLDFVRGKDLADFIEDYRQKESGEIREVNVWEDYINHIFSSVEAEKINPFKIVIDAGNGMAGKVIPKISSRLPVELISLNFELDGNFPAHPSNPLEKGSTDQISREIIDKGADFGFIFDGDADRIYLIDEKGNFIQADITLLLLAKYLLKKNPGKGIIYNAICSKAVPEFIKKWGGNPVKTAVGVVELKKAMEEEDGIMGGELSGHYLFKNNYCMDSGFISFLILLQIISESGRRVSEITKELSLYFKSAEINFEAKGKQSIIEKLKEKYNDGDQEFLDGITVNYKDWWFNARPSQTEPLLRLTIEADSEKILEKKKKELTSFIKKLV
jgi:phosphomannomutase